MKTQHTAWRTAFLRTFRTLASIGAASKSRATRPTQVQALSVRPGMRAFKAAATLPLMPHPLAAHLAPIIDEDVDRLRTIVAEWVVNATTAEERASYRRFGVELSALKRRIAARSEPPSEEEVEIALTALLALAGRASREEVRRRELDG